MPMPPTDRLGLINALNGLPLVQFNALVFELQPPVGLMAPPMAPQGDRAFALVSWAESYGGCGLEKVGEALQTVLANPTQLSNTSPEQFETLGSGSINVGGNVSGSVFVTGSGVSVFVGKENPPPSGGSAHNRHNLPRSGVTKFVGRETELETLHEKLQQSGRLNIAAIKGMGGIGKSELALQYAYRHRNLGSYLGGLCWLDLRSGDLGGQLVRFARLHLGLTFPDNMPLNDQVTLCWQQWPTGEALLVYDNAGEYGELQPFLPPADPRFRVLITSRNRMGSPVETLEILVLEEGASLELLGVLAGKDRVQSQIGDAKELCRRLGYLPLAIELVGRYLAADPDLSITQMLKRLEEKGLSAKALAETEQGMTGKLGVEAAFELSWQSLEEKGQELGCVLSLFAEAPIPWKLVEACLPESDAEELEGVRNKQLSGLSLLERLDQAVYQLHPLIREFFGQKREQFAGVEGLKRGYCRVMVSQAQEFPETPTLIQREGFAPGVPHLAEIADRLLEWVEGKDLIWAFVGLSRYYDGQGTYAQAQQWYQRCLEESRRRLGEEHPDTLTSMHHLAGTLSSQGYYAGARKLQEQVLEARRRVLGEEYPDTLTSMNGLAYTLSSQGEYAAARSLFEQVLEIRRSVLGEEHPDTLASMNNLADTLYSQGDYVGARKLQEQVLEACQRVLGEEHPSTLLVMNNLAQTLHSQGEYAAARSLFEKVLEIRRSVLGEEHPDTLASMNNLAWTFSCWGEHEKAESLYVEAVEKSMRLLGEEHPWRSCYQKNYLDFLSDIVQKHPEAMTKLLSNASSMTKQILKQMQKDKELGNPTQEG